MRRVRTKNEITKNLSVIYGPEIVMSGLAEFSLMFITM